MMRRLLLSGLLCIGTALGQTPPPGDTLIMVTGERRPGRITGLDAQGFSLEVQVAGGQGTGTIRVPRTSVTQVEFAPDATRESLLAHASAAQLQTIASLWLRWEAYLQVPRSPAGRVGIKYADLLTDSNSGADGAKALSLLQQIEKDAWSPDDRTAAKQTRLRALVATGKAEEAAEQAKELVKSATSPEILADAKYILAKANEGLLRKLLEENPRWEEDDRIRPERARLLNETLDLYLYPSLFVGALSEPAARGLWGAVGVYKLVGENKLAVESAKDIVILHPASRFVKPAQEFIVAQPKEGSPPEMAEAPKASQP